MKTIGLIGGMSWQSSIEYYRMINEAVADQLGGTHSAKCVMVSLDFAEIEKLQFDGRWDELSQILISSALRLQEAGADFVLICTNTMHLLADEVQNSIRIPLLHIADAAGESIRNSGIRTVGLLGTYFTMEKDFYKVRLKDKFGIRTIIPDESEMEIIHAVIYDELVTGIINPTSKGKYLEIMGGLVERGAGGIVLGCTEIGLLVNEHDTSIPLFETSSIHALAAVKMALN
jgi:aspartate racemase